MAHQASHYQRYPGQIRNWKAVAVKLLIDLSMDRKKSRGIQIISYPMKNLTNGHALTVTINHERTQMGVFSI
ncbi:MAG: hypothetical protein A2464_14470 [Deltaproteobacteria bacterium RIFOXYC2_FULL_48_10]|nr:MAG: hypothetical protein A2464_14470 [Deltaproteobacteria bacterium RIFOXYC2_FULL_48_10]